MTPNCHRLMVASAVVAFVCTSALAALAAEPVVWPRVHGLYQQKLERLNAGSLPQLFLGSASVAPDHSQPYMVSLGLKGVRTELGHYCGGSIIDPHWVLTAAHCVSTATMVDGKQLIIPLDPGKAQVKESSNVLFRGEDIRSIARIVIHPEHRLTGKDVPENDLALLQFTQPLASKPIRLANLAQSEKLLQPGAALRILGWGTATFAADSPISNNLLFAFVDVRDRAKCNDADAYAGAVTDTMFCAGFGTADACQGDSGGPAVGYVNGEPLLIGIISWGAGCTQKKYPGVYVNVAKYEGWINATIKSSKP